MCVMYPTCQQPRPRNVTEAEACKVDWNNFVNETLAEHFNGGGGGGGASMIIMAKEKN